jgi:predicted AAA+ superfamily ATPase
MSLSARFGLTVTFSRPDKDLYLSIVHKLAYQYGIEIPEAQLDIRAEAHAIRNGGRSPRVAKQFIELTKSGV